MIKFSHKGDFSRLSRFLNKAKDAIRPEGILDKYGREGVTALASATPYESGQTASSWYYELKIGAEQSEIIFSNSHFNKGVPIAIILQYGHGTGTGGWVEGRDYINPAIQPIFDRIANEAWKEVTKL